MAGKKVPDRLINFMGYLEGGALAGIADVELPTLTPMSETLSGAGILGEIESPILGQYESMETSINWRTITRDAVRLAAPGAHLIDFRGSMQIMDATTGGYTTEAVRASMKIINKEYGLGSFEPNATTDSEQTFEVTYFKLFIGGKEVVEIDKLSGVVKFNGKDYLASYRKDIGMA